MGVSAIAVALGVSIVALTACGNASSPSIEATASANASNAATITNVGTSAPSAPVRAQDWTGEYRGKDVTAKIKPAPRAGQYEVEILDENSGGGTGVGTVKGAVLTAVLPNGNTADGWKECRVSFQMTPAGVKVSGDANCSGVLGSGHTLDGVYKRVDGTVAGVPTATASVSQSTNWLIGNWVSDLAYCRGDSAMIFKADGTYGFEDEDGRWIVTGKTITFRSPGNPARTVEIVERSASRVKLRYANGTTLALFKCPTAG